MKKGDVVYYVDTACGTIRKVRIDEVLTFGFRIEYDRYKHVTSEYDLVEKREQAIDKLQQHIYDSQYNLDGFIKENEV